MIHPILSVQAHYQAFIAPRYARTRAGRNIAKYKDKHKGERCFILGNGPSLSASDLELLHRHNIVTFATNRIYRIFPDTTWRPTYYVCEDPLIIRDHQKEIQQVPAKEKFIPIELKWYHEVNIEGALYFHICYKPETVNEWGFSPDIAKVLVNRGTVTYACMQLAVYMGFEKIYLLGVDHNFQVTIDVDGNVITDLSVKDYFCEKYDDDIKDEVVHDMRKNTAAYIAAREYCEKHTDSEILNATRGGKLEVFERVDFDEIIKIWKS